MITPDKAQQDYRAAMSALQQSAMTPGMPSAERMLIRNAILELTLQYLDHLEAEISALTSQYTTFITSMAGVVESLKGGVTPASILKQLTTIVTRGSALIKSPPGAKALSGRKRAAAGGKEPLRVLCIHGVGHQEQDPAFESTWRN